MDGRTDGAILICHPKFLRGHKKKERKKKKSIFLQKKKKKEKETISSNAFKKILTEFILSLKMVCH